MHVSQKFGGTPKFGTNKSNGYNRYAPTCWQASLSLITMLQSAVINHISHMRRCRLQVLSDPPQVMQLVNRWARFELSSSAWKTTLLPLGHMVCVRLHTPQAVPELKFRCTWNIKTFPRRVPEQCAVAIGKPPYWHTDLSPTAPCLYPHDFGSLLTDVPSGLEVTMFKGAHILSPHPTPPNQNFPWFTLIQLHRWEIHAMPALLLPFSSTSAPVATPPPPQLRPLWYSNCIVTLIPCPIYPINSPTSLLEMQLGPCHCLAQKTVPLLPPQWTLNSLTSVQDSPWFDINLHTEMTPPIFPITYVNLPPEPANQNSVAQDLVGQRRYTRQILRSWAWGDRGVWQLYRRHLGWLMAWSK